MNKELSDRVWKMLPKEFKEEVKEEYFACKHCSAEASAMEIEIIFGEHNLTSDAEGEEMLTAMKWKVQEQYANYNKELQHDGLRHIEYEKAKEVVKVLYYLFGSKCLRDETCNVASKEPNPSEEDDVFNDPEPKCLYFKGGKCAHPAVAHLENGKLVKGADCDVSSCEDVEYEPKPAEPKFKEGDRAIYCIPEKQRIKARVVNVRQRSGSTLFNTLFNYDIRLDDGRTANWVDEQWLLPDNDDQVRAVTEKASEQFDRIIKDDFKKHNRLNIAAMAMAGMIVSPVDYRYDDIAKFALEYADALIAEAEKGGGNA